VGRVLCFSLKKLKNHAFGEEVVFQIMFKNRTNLSMVKLSLVKETSLSSILLNNTETRSLYRIDNYVNNKS